MRKTFVLLVLAGLCAVIFLSAPVPTTQAKKDKLHKSTNKIENSYIVVLDESVIGERGIFSIAPYIASELASNHKGKLKHVYQHAINGFAVEIGRYQPWHEGHRALFLEALAMEGHVVIGIRETHGQGDQNPFTFAEVKARIEESLSAFAGSFEIRRLPNITNIVYGRDVGYRITRINLEPEIEGISATQIRSTLNLGGDTVGVAIERAS